MQTFNFLSVSTVEEAVAALSRGVSRPLAGGTDLIPMLREGRRTADAVVDVKRIPELMSLEIGAQGVLTIGASVSCQRISRDPEIARRWPGLIDGISLIGGTQIQGRASLGGNLCTASPAGDAIPALIVHGATLVIAGPGGRREMAAATSCLVSAGMRSRQRTPCSSGSRASSVSAPRICASFRAMKWTSPLPQPVFRCGSR
jgi:carbon-monoxide dehydrogenase medium subunit